MIKCKILKTNPPADRKDLFYIIFVTSCPFSIAVGLLLRRMNLCGCAVTQKNKLLRRGIEREFEIIGEAMNRILKEEQGRFGFIPNQRNRINLFLPQTGYPIAGSSMSRKPSGEPNIGSKEFFCHDIDSDNRG